MKVTIEVQLVDFSVPSVVYVRQPKEDRQGGFKPPQSIPLSMLKTEELRLLCENFVKGVYANAHRSGACPILVPPSTNTFSINIDGDSLDDEGDIKI